MNSSAILLSEGKWGFMRQVHKTTCDVCLNMGALVHGKRERVTVPTPPFNENLYVCWLVSMYMNGKKPTKTEIIEYLKDQMYDDDEWEQLILEIIYYRGEEE